MLTDEEIVTISQPVLDQHLYEEDVCRFARALIAAHEAKRMQPEEWRVQAGTLIAAFARAVEGCWSNSTTETRHAYINAQKAIITHISTPPAGMVLVPEEPTGSMAFAGMHVNSEWLNDSAPIGEQRYRLPAIAVYKAMIAAAKGETK